MIKKFSVNVDQKSLEKSVQYVDELAKIVHLTASIVRYCLDVHLQKAQSIRVLLGSDFTWDVSSITESEVVLLIGEAHRATAFIHFEELGIPYIGLRVEWFNRKGSRIMGMYCVRTEQKFRGSFVKG